MNDEDKLRNSLQPGHKLHWYQMEKVLGQGGFGITYLAYDTNLDQHVAIKEYLPMELAVREGDFSVYPASQAQDSRYRWGLDRFLAEARTLARFKHPAIVRVLSVFEENNTAYMVMEYQQGESLQHVLDVRGTLPEHELIALVVPLMDGLDVIHAQGFIHRDIKPSNIYIRTDGHPVLLDFGSARQALGEETQTLTSVVSPGYAPFEQYYSKSDRQGPWTDIYGLGATLYRCISGLQPMAAIDRSEAILKAERDVFVPASEIGAGKFSAGFLNAIDVALAFNEKKRPQTVSEWRPVFEISTSVETELLAPLHTTYPEDSPTRFSALAEETLEVPAGTVQNPDARRSQRAAQRSERASSRQTQPQAPRSRREPGVRQESSRRNTSQPVSHSGRNNASAFAQPPRRRWPWVVALLSVLLIAGGGGYAYYAGLLPDKLLAGPNAADFAKQGDRALAVGKVFEPFEGSALDFYIKAYELNPHDADAGHGLRLTGERLVAAMREALDQGDYARVSALQTALERLPEAEFELEVLQQGIAMLQAEQDEENKRAEQIDQLLADAAAHVKAERLVGDGTNNALATYRAVQVIQPDNADAAKGLTALATALAEQGLEALVFEDTQAALAAHSQAVLIDSDAPRVQALWKALETEREAEQQAASVDELLAAADADLEANRLTTPADSNALARYQKVLELDPGNNAAKRGIQQIHDRYILLGTRALAEQSFDQASQMAAKARLVEAESSQARTLINDVAAARARLDRETAERLAREAEQRAAQAEAQRQAAERARQAAEAERRRRQEEEAQRLLAEAQAQAEAERKAREAEAQLKLDAENGKPRMVLDFYGFHPKYKRDGMDRDEIYRQVAPLIRAAGYDIVTRDMVHDANYKWTNVRIMAYRLNVNENTATGLYSYAGSLNIFPGDMVVLPIRTVLEKPAEWNRGDNGLGPPSDLSGLRNQYVEFTRAYLQNRPGQRNFR